MLSHILRKTATKLFAKNDVDLLFCELILHSEYGFNMPKKLKRALVGLATWCLGSFWALVCLASFGGLLPSLWLTFLNAIVCIIFIVGLAWQCWSIYCGLYRDGSFSSMTSMNTEFLKEKRKIERTDNEQPK